MKKPFYLFVGDYTRGLRLNTMNSIATIIEQQLSNAYNQDILNNYKNPVEEFSKTTRVHNITKILINAYRELMNLVDNYEEIKSSIVTKDGKFICDIPTVQTPVFGCKPLELKLTTGNVLFTIALNESGKPITILNAEENNV